VGKPAIVMGDLITGSCPIHLIPGALGAPQPAPPMPFSAPITLNTVPTVLIQGKPAATIGSQGLNASVHAGLHPADPFLAPPMQKGTILGASPTVLIGGKPAAAPTPPPLMCATPGTVTGTAVTVLIG
jgi:uncharacterized Zn-binding protein involved in type VI secretion